MQKMQCPGCGKAFRFQGVAGVCPFCATVVRAPRSRRADAGKVSRKPKPAPLPDPLSSTGSMSSTGVLSAMESLSDGPEAVTPPGTGRTTPGDSGSGKRSGPAGLDRRLLLGIAGVLTAIVGFGLFEVLHTPSQTTPVAIVPPIPLPPAPPSQPPPAAVPPPAEPLLAAVKLPPPPVDVPVPWEAVALPAWYGLHPVAPVLPPVKIDDAMVERSLLRGIGYLKPMWAAGAVPHANQAWATGTDELVTYALLHAGAAVNDSDLEPSSTLMGTALEHLKAEAPDQAYATYAYSVRAQALALANRAADRAELERSHAWLVRAEVNGAYGYTMPTKEGLADPASVPWDGSNSQYGVLGVWAASEAGVTTSPRYWEDVKRHWVDVQGTDGGWGYHPGNSSTPMTAAGVTTLCVAAEQQEITAHGSAGEGSGGGGSGTEVDLPRPRALRRRGGEGGGGGGGGKAKAAPPVSSGSLTDAIDRGLDYIGSGDHWTDTGLDPGYALYGIERAALATGYRYFGPHDWYRELGAAQIALQDANGSWSGWFDAPIATSFRLLFLARGRQPLLMDKLKFEGDWNDRPRDVAKLTNYVSTQLERPFAWGVADLDRNWTEWLDAPMLFITTDAAPTFSDDACRKLRAYSDAGGFIVLHNEFDSKDVDAFAAALARRVFPEYPLSAVPPSDLLYHTVVSMRAGTRPLPPLMRVGNGTRPLLVYSPGDVSRTWVGWRTHDSRTDPDLELGLNLFVAAAGTGDFRNRLDSPYLGPSSIAPAGTVPVQRLTYAGGRCDPEPGAWTRFARWFALQTSLAMDVRPTAIGDVDLNAGPVAVLTGNAGVDFSKVDLHPLQAFVQAGGTLLVDAAGGNAAFAQAVHEQLLPQAFGGATSEELPAAHPILAGVGDCMTPLPKPRLRTFATQQLGGGAPPGVQYLSYGSGTVIVSDLDLTTALLDSHTYGILGYTPDYANALYKNAILFTLRRFQSSLPTAAATTQPGVTAAN